MSITEETLQVRECHFLPIEHVANQFSTHREKGLTWNEAERRLNEYGPNELIEKPHSGLLKMLFEQFNNFLIIILIVASIVSMLLGETIDAIAIIVIIMLNAVVGVIQESKAEAAFAALKKMAAPNAKVIRDGHQETIPSREIVPGDVVIIEAGNYVPADMRLIESINLKIEEASLTGESVPVEKNAHIVLDKEIPIGDRKNSAFMSTMVTYGRGKGLVTATGMHTQMGLIAQMLQSYEEEQTPLQRKLDHLAKVLGTGCLIICIIVFVYGLIRDTHFETIFKDGLLSYFLAEKRDIIELFMTAVSLAIAAVPEGLPAVVTICLALGMRRMIKRHALIRKLPAVETLGCATVICSDKTGTLTQNKMTVVQVWSGGYRFKVTGEGYSPAGEFLLNRQPIDPLQYPEVSLLLHGALLCNDARLEKGDEGQGDETFTIVGDPTEGAMIVAAAKGGLWQDRLKEVLPRIKEIPFDSERKRMTTVHTFNRNYILKVDIDSPEGIIFVKGAPDIILGLCNFIMEDGHTIPLTDEKKQAVLEINKNMARQALRVLGIAFKPLRKIPDVCDPDSLESNLIFVGLIGMIDPPRSEAMEAVRVAKEAGLKSIMVTGDYKDTAEAVAKEIGLLEQNGKILTGMELDAMSNDELINIIHDVNVCCRVSPQHKTKIVDALKARGHIVAMTGDGVNDAPALKRADIGIAMGITGTDVTKETADMVLTDDNYASIVSAIEEGRIIYSNIRKFVNFLLTCNIGEILIVFLAMFFGMPLPLNPIMLLWLNLVTDGAPALALGLEQGEPDIMKRPSRPVKEPLINKRMTVGITIIPIIDAIAILSLFSIGLSRYPDSIATAQTMVFATLSFSEVLRAYTSRSERYSLFSIGFLSNRWMQWAAGSSIVLILITMYIPFLRPFFGTVMLGLNDWIIMASFILMAPVATEVLKIVMRKYEA